MKQTWNFQSGAEFKPNNPLWERYGYFLEQYIGTPGGGGGGLEYKKGRGARRLA